MSGPMPQLSSVSPCFAKQIVRILRVLCYNGKLITWTVLSLTTAKFKPPIFSMSGFALSYTANMFIRMILYDFCLMVYIRKVESRVQIACAPPSLSLLYFTESNCPAYNISARTTQKTPSLCCCFQLMPWKHVRLRSRYSVRAVV
jgi:hypothetical protein